MHYNCVRGLRRRSGLLQHSRKLVVPRLAALLSAEFQPPSELAVGILLVVPLLLNRAVMGATPLLIELLELLPLVLFPNLRGSAHGGGSARVRVRGAYLAPKKAGIILYMCNM